MLSEKVGKPGLFARIYDEKDWIMKKLTVWSDWTSCDHTCKSTRVRGCGLVDSNETEKCENGLVTETDDCKAANYTSGKMPGDEKILQPDGNFGCYPATQNILPKSEIENNSLQMCDVKVARFRREFEVLDELETLKPTVINQVRDLRT